MKLFSAGGIIIRMVKWIGLFLYVIIPGMINAARIPPNHYEEMNIELADIKYALNRARVEMEILEERIAKIENQYANSKKEIEAAIRQQEDAHIHVLRTIEEKLDTHEKKFQEIAALKHVIYAIALPKEKQAHTHHVQQGDTLEKIARTHHVTIESLKKCNHLTDDRIYIGQKLTLPSK